jgi:hypothetical protein
LDGPHQSHNSVLVFGKTQYKMVYRVSTNEIHKLLFETK